MKNLVQKSRITQLMEQRNGYLTLSAGLIALCILLVLLLFYTTNREKIVIVPPVVHKSFWVSSNAVSPEYLSEMTLFFTYLRMNMTPSNVVAQREMLLRYVDPRYYGKLKNTLVADGDKVTLEHLNIAFYPANIKVDEKAMTAIITGDLISSVGTTELPPQRVNYQISYRYDDGRLMVSDFSEVEKVDGKYVGKAVNVNNAGNVENAKEVNGNA